MKGLDFELLKKLPAKPRREQVWQTRRRVIITAFVLLAISLAGIIGCGGGLGVMNTLDTTLTSGLSQSWEYIRNGEYNKALDELTKLYSAAATTTEKQQVAEAMGWAWLYKGDLDKAISYLKEAQEVSFDAKFGLACALIARGQDGDFQEAYNVLVQTPLKDLTSQIVSDHGLSYNAAEAHALFAIAAFATGRMTEARSHIIKAKELDTGYGYSPVSRVYDSLVKDLGV